MIVRRRFIGVVAIVAAVSACVTTMHGALPTSPTRPTMAVAATSGPALPLAAAAPKSGRGNAPVNNVATETVSLADFARRYQLKLEWVEPQKQVRLSGGLAQVELEVGSREFSIGGVRAFLGEAVRFRQDRVVISKIDAERLIGPIVRPSTTGRAPAPKLVVLDPGHGGKDTGKINQQLNVFEKQLTLDVATRLKTLLEARGFRVILTRTDDRYVGLTDRPDKATDAGADLFVSIHFNSVESGADRVTGVEVFTMTPQYQLSTDQSPDSQAGKRNPGNFYDGWNAILGYTLHKTLLDGLKVEDRGLKRGRLAVLRMASCPAVLVEGGYLSNPGETRKLMTPAYRQRIAQALADGIVAYSRLTQAAR